MSDTHETDAAVLQSEGQWSFVLKECCQRLERERNKMREALEEISSLDTSQDASPQQCEAVLIAMNTLEGIE
jgi:hypothetical protein